MKKKFASVLISFIMLAVLFPAVVMQVNVQASPFKINAIYHPLISPTPTPPPSPTVPASRNVMLNVDYGTNNNYWYISISGHVENGSAEDKIVFHLSPSLNGIVNCDENGDFSYYNTTGAGDRTETMSLNIYFENNHIYYKDLIFTPPDGHSISGTVFLQGRSDHSGIIVSLINTSFSTTTDINGNYSLSGVPQGSYKIRYSYPTFILVWGSGTDIDVSDIDVNAPFSPVLLGGDIDMDNYISFSDFTVFVLALDSTSSSQKYNVFADIDVDGYVSFIDFTMFVANSDKVYS